ncbi:MAG: D-alanyl-D-alanine carboxypeptidase family protein [Anaerovoracaceae bacterium]
MNKLSNQSLKQNTFVGRFLLMILILMVLLVTMFNFNLDWVYSKDTKTKEVKLPKVNSASAIVINSKNGALLYDKDKDKRIYPASTTKVLTAIVAIENGKLDDVITVSENALKGMEKGGAHIALDAGEEITLNNALYGLLMASANECAIAIAEHISGTEEEFAKLMNKKAADLGLTDSNFTNASGLFNKNHYSTAHDLAMITSYAIKNPDFLRIFSTLSYTIPPSNIDKEPKLINNGHRMVKLKSWEYHGVVGGKRGFITESKFNLITYANRDDMGLITVTTKGDSERVNLEDTKNLFDYFYKNYKLVYLPEKINDTPIEDNLNGDNRILAASTYNKDDLTGIIAKTADKDQIKGSIKTKEKLDYPINKGEKTGEIIYTLDNEPVSIVPLVAKEEIKSNKYLVLIKYLLMGLAVILLIFALILGILIIRAKRIKRRNAAIIAKRRKNRL